MISILTAIKLPSPTLQATVASVSQQTPACYEHLLQHSSSHSADLPSWLQKEQLNIESSPDTGLYDALNKGFNRCSGDILCWLNSDEQLLEGTLNYVQEYFESHPKTDLLFGDYLLTTAEGRPIAYRQEIPPRSWYLRHGVNYIMSCATFFRRSLWEKNGPFDTSLKFLGDKDWYMRALKAGANFEHTRRFMATFGISENNLSLSDATLLEQQLVRERYRAYSSPIMRKMVRSARCTEKLIRGCYGKKQISIKTFDPSGNPQSSEDILGTKWQW